jgi:thiamine biosynthesis protein ThiS
MRVTVNGAETELPEATNGAALLERLGVPAAALVAEVNGAVLTLAQFAKLAIQDRDVIELVTLVGGG